MLYLSHRCVHKYQLLCVCIVSAVGMAGHGRFAQISAGTACCKAPRLGPFVLLGTALDEEYGALGGRY